MSRKPKIITPLRQVRLATGMLQRKFAKFIGVGYDLYQKLEAGRARLTPKTCRLVYSATGANPEMLDHEHFQLALDLNRQPYTRKSFERWKKGEGRGAEKTDAKTEAQRLGEWVELLLRAAEAAGALPQVAGWIGEQLCEAQKDFGLEAKTEALLKERPLVLRISHTYGELRRDPELAAVRGFKDKKYRDGKIISDNEVEIYHVPIIPIPFNPRIKLPPLWEGPPKKR